MGGVRGGRSPAPFFAPDAGGAGWVDAVSGTTEGASDDARERGRREGGRESGAVGDVREGGSGCEVYDTDARAHAFG